MMNWWIIRHLSEMRQEEILKDAERLRRLRLYEATGRKPKRHFHALLANLGKLLVRYGSFLEERYGATARRTFSNSIETGL